MQTEMELTLEQTQQGVSYEVSEIQIRRKLKDGVKEFQRSFRHSDTKRLSRSDEVLKLKNFKKDATLKLFKSTNQERYRVPMIGSGSEPIIGLAKGMFQKVMCQAVSGGSGIYQDGNDWVLGRGSRGNHSQSLAIN
ncbi:hypothetical protein Tco_0642871 [Tanacetum coccineum]